MSKKYIDSIFESKRKNELDSLIARKIYFSYPNKVFIDNEDLQFDIINEISIFFETPFYNIHMVGSSKIGYSPWKNREFINGESDLDIAIIDINMFKKYMEISYKATKGLNDLTKFKNLQDYEAYKKYICR